MVPEFLHVVVISTVLGIHPVHNGDNGFCTPLTLFLGRERHGIIYHVLYFSPILWQYESLALCVVI